MTMRVTRILHHSVNVAGALDPATGFYQQVFGLTDAVRPDIPGVGGHWFSVGDAQIHLVDADAGDGAIRPTGPHVCLGVEDLAAAEAELEAAGIATVAFGDGAGRQVWVADPAGHTIELQQDPEGSPTRR